jgi:hypothetical protein
MALISIYSSLHRPSLHVNPEKKHKYPGCPFIWEQ